MVHRVKVNKPLARKKQNPFPAIIWLSEIYTADTALNTNQPINVAPISRCWDLIKISFFLRSNKDDTYAIWNLKKNWTRWLNKFIWPSYLHNTIISLSGRSYQFGTTQYVVHVKHEKDICASSFYHHRWVQYTQKEKKVMF